MAYVSLSTANLPDPVVDPAQGQEASDHFETVIWTGDGTSGRSITTGHQPDFVWTKERNSAINHIAQNSISGTGKYLHPNTSAEEQSASTLITSFDSDGFTIGNSGSINGSSDTYVAWSWKAGGTAGSNTDGSITSQVSADTTRKFSIFTYTGNGSNLSQVGHGLGTTPEFCMIKGRSSGATGTQRWFVKVPAVCGAGEILELDTTNQASQTGNGIQTMSSATVTLGIDTGNVNGINESGKDYVGFAWASVDGFSKFGSYDDSVVGSDYENTSPFIYTGFRPAFLMIKGTSNGREWVMYDNKRTPDGGVYLRANTSAIEQTDATNHDISFLSNGFKIRGGSGDINTTGESYLYMCFGDQPFKFANGGTE